MSATTPFVCDDCKKLNKNWYAPCPHAMTKAKGSDVRAAYVDTGTPKCPVCQMPMNGSVECHLPNCTLRVLQEAEVEARVQAAAVEMREECAVFVQDNEGHDPDCPWHYSPDDDHVVNCTCEAKELADKVRTLPIPTKSVVK